MSSIKTLFSHVPRIAYIIFAISFLARLLILVSLLVFGGEDALLWGDSLQYKNAGENVVAGLGYTNNSAPETYRAPGYPAFFIILKALSLPLWVGSVFQIVVASMIPIFAYLLARRHLILSKKASIIVAMFTALEPVQVYYSVVLLPDVFFAVFFLASIFFLIHWLRNQDVRDVIFAGVSIGLANYMRPATIYFPIFVILFFAVYLRKECTRKKILHFFIFIATTFLIMAPWYARNYINFGKIGFVTAGSYNQYFYGAAATEALATGKKFEEVNQRFVSKLREDAPDKRNLSGFGNQNYLRGHSREIIFAHPFQYIKLYFLGLNTFLFSGNYHFLLSVYNIVDVPENLSFSLFLAENGIYKTVIKVLSLATTPYVFIALVGKIFWLFVVLVSLLGAWRYRKTSLSLIYFISIFYFCVTIASVTIGVEARHRYMLNPLIFVLSAGMISQIYDRYFCRRPVIQ